MLDPLTFVRLGVERDLRHQPDPDLSSARAHLDRDTRVTVNLALLAVRISLLLGFLILNPISLELDPPFTPTHYVSVHCLLHH
jgi:hypothetical protein